MIGVGRTDLFRSLPPPNRAGGFPAHGSPVGGFTSKRIDTLTHGLLSGYTVPDQQSTPPLTPCTRAVNICSVQTVGSVHVHRRRSSPARLILSDTASGWFSIGWDIAFPPPCTPWLPRRYPVSSLSGRRRRTKVLASVRRSNWTCGFPASSFHKGASATQAHWRTQEEPKPKPRRA